MKPLASVSNFVHDSMKCGGSWPSCSTSCNSSLLLVVRSAAALALAEQGQVACEWAQGHRLHSVIHSLSFVPMWHHWSVSSWSDHEPSVLGLLHLALSGGAAVWPYAQIHFVYHDCPPHLEHLVEATIKCQWITDYHNSVGVITLKNPFSWNSL